MAKGLNKVQLIGRLGATPEMRYTAQGNAVTTFRIAVDRVWKDASGAQQSETDWFRIVVWNTLAERCNQFLDAGRLVYVEGRLQIRKWADQDNQTRAVTEIVAQDVIFLDGRRDADGPPNDRADEPTGAVPGPHQPAIGRSKASAPPASSRTTSSRSRPQHPSSKEHGRRRPTPSRGSANGHATGSFDEEELPF